jgi:outer membrane protein
MLRSCLCFALLLAPAAAHAAETGKEASAPRVVTLREAVQLARGASPALRAARARALAAEEEARAPRGQWLPLVGVTAQVVGGSANNTTASVLSVRGVPLPRIGGTRVVAPGSMEPYPSTLVAAGVQQEIFDFGRIAAQRAAADALAQVEAQRARGLTLDVAYDVEEAYYAVYAAKSIVAASGDAYERAKVHRDYARASVEAGLRPPIELTRAEADLTKLDLGRIRADGALRVAQSGLAAAVGVPDAALDVASAAPTPGEIPSLEAARSGALGNNPRVQEALAWMRAEEQRARAIGAEARPDVALTGAISGRAGGAPPSGNGETPTGSGWLPCVPNWDVGLVLSWPLFDGVQHERERAAHAREAQRSAELTAVEREIVARVDQAYVRAQVARSALEGLRRAVDAAHANYAQAEARFKSGLGTSVELADAESLRTEAEIQLALGAFEVARTRAALGRILGEER